jgi:hypothetical protein
VFGDVVKLVDTVVLEATASRHRGSSPRIPTARLTLHPGEIVSLSAYRDAIDLYQVEVAVKGPLHLSMFTACALHWMAQR